MPEVWAAPSVDPRDNPHEDVYKVVGALAGWEGAGTPIKATDYPGADWNLQVQGTGQLAQVLDAVGGNALTSTDALLSSDKPTELGSTLDVTDAGTFGSTLDVAGNTTVGGTLVVTGATTLQATLSVAGNTTIGGTLGVTGATTLQNTLTVVGATALQSTLVVTGATTLQNTLTVVGATALQSTLAVTGAATFASTVAITGNLTVDTNVLVVNVTTNRVGINQASPAQDLDITGNMRITGQILMLTGTPTLPALSFDGDTNTGLYRPAPDWLGFVVNGIEYLTIDAAGNVGIRKPTGIAAALHTGAGSWVLDNNATTPTFRTQILADQWILGSENPLTTKWLFQHRADASYNIRWTAQGIGTLMEWDRLNLRVGIAKTAPLATLDVNGKILCSGELEVDGAFNHDGTTFGAMGAAPVTRRTLGAAAIDAATTQALANNLRQALIDLGLGQT